MKRAAFTLMEAIVVISVIGAVSALSLPLYREYQIRSDLDNAAQITTQGLSRAKQLSQTGKKDAPWGFYVPAGILYKGGSYAARDAQFDEKFPMPSTIAVSGLLDVSYSKIQGLPSGTGSIVLKALNNDQRIIQVTIAVNKQTLPATGGDTFVICHHASAPWQTISVPDALWPTHQAHGDTMGACAMSSSSSSRSSSVSSSLSSSSRSSSVSSSSSSSAAGGGGSCAAKFTVSTTDQLITLTAASAVTFTNMESLITFGAGGPPVEVHACYSTNAGSSFSTLFGSNGNCSGNGNAYGSAVQTNGTDIKTLSLPSGSKLAILLNGRYRQQGWLAFDETFQSNDRSGHILFLRNGDLIGNYVGFGAQTPLKSYLVSKGKANASGQITISSCEVLAIVELGALGTTSSDFQDDVMLLTFN